MTGSLAHTDAVEVDQYKAAGWWGEATVGRFVARWAAERPAGIAYVADEGRMSWREYDARASRLADALVGSGLPRASRVAVLLPDGLAVHIAFIAAERAGVTMVGLGHRAGDREIRHILEKTGAEAIITTESHRGRNSAEFVRELQRHGLPLHQHFVMAEDGAGDPTVNGEVDTSASGDGTRGFGADDLFLINSTSGTTGMPKCVMHNQNRWLYFHQLAATAGEMSPEDVFFGAVPAPFGFGLWTSHFTPNMLGSATVVTQRFDAERTLELVEQERVTVLACVSTQFLMMLNSPDIEHRDLTSLRCMFTGGEAVPYERAARFEDVTDARVLQFYGSNETGALSNTNMSDDREHRLRSAGRTIPEMRVRLLDDEDRDITEPDVPGHPVCRGPATCLGYLDDEDANAELFTEDGWMRIGDLVTIDADGYLHVVGRTSDIIIRGGKNISAPALEAEVATNPAIAVAAAVSMPDPIFGERVCLYVELKSGATLSLDDVVAHLKGRGVSPDWLPERLVVMDSLPRASGGKVAKGELRLDVRNRLEAEARSASR